MQLLCNTVLVSPVQQSKLAISINIQEGNGTPLQYSCLENPMDGGAWWAAVHGVSKSRTRPSDFTFTSHFHVLKEMATHSSVLAWKIPGTGEPGGLPSMGSHRVGHDWSDLEAAAAAAAVPSFAQNYVFEICLMNCFRIPHPKYFIITAWHHVVQSSAAAAAAKSLQSCPTLCHPIDGSRPCSPVPGIFQARTLEWVAISFSNAWKWKVKVKSFSCVWPSTTPWTAAF